MSLFFKIIGRELKIHYRRKSDCLNAVLLFLLTVIIFPLGVGPEPDTLREIGFGIIWVAVIFATMLSLRSLFNDDYDDGSLEQMAISPVALEIVVLAKNFAVWAIFLLPVVVATPLAGLMFGLAPQESLLLMLTLLIASPIFVMLGSICAALTLGSQKERILLSLLVIPLYIPALIFGVSASKIFILDIDSAAIGPNLLILFGLFLFSLPLSAWTGGFVLKNG